MNTSDFDLVFPAGLWHDLQAHLFPGDQDEHGAVLLAGVADTPQGMRLLVRDLIKAVDGVDYVPGQHGYRALDPLFIARVARSAQREQLAYLAVHCHGGTDSVSFSAVDLASHERGYPALLQLIGRPVGGLVLARNAVAGDLWFAGGRAALLRTRVIGTNVRTLTATKSRKTISAPNLAFDRQARLLGAVGQQRLRELRVAVVGLGGAGSMVAEMLVRLGIGELVYIDPDRIEASNISRIVGSSTADLGSSRQGLLRRIFKKRAITKAATKIDIAKRSAAQSQLGTRIEAYAEDVASRKAAASLTNCDWIVLAADSQTSRYVVNAIAHAYLIPVIQVGVKVPVDAQTGTVGDLFCVARHITPDRGCLLCNGLIDPTELQLEATGAEGQRARQYVGHDAPAPSVITLNGISVSLGVTELLLSVAQLLDEGRPSAYERFAPRKRRFWLDEPRQDADCPHCSPTSGSLFATGDGAVLPLLSTSQDRRGRG